MVGDPNSIVSDDAKSRTKVVKFLIFASIQYGLNSFLRGISRYETERTSEERGKFLHSLLNCANEALAREPAEKVRGPPVQTASLVPLARNEIFGGKFVSWRTAPCPVFRMIKAS